MELILPLAESGAKVPSDIYCLCGRIYKDMFISSGFSDNHSRDQACYWCGRCSCGTEASLSDCSIMLCMSASQLNPTVSLFFDVSGT